MLRIRLTWRNLAEMFEISPGTDAEVDDADLERIELEVRAALKALPPFAGRPFALPPELKTFYKLAGNRLVAGPRATRAASGFRFYAADWLPTDGLHFADEAEGDSCPWIEIGSFDDHRWVFLCCDPEDPLYGAVLPRTNATPWSRTVYEAETFPSLAAFLEDLAAIPAPT